MQAIILAGGFGTRLQAVVKDVPKPLADISSRPFLSWLLQDLSNHGVKKAVISVGYMKEKIIENFGNSFHGMEICYASEDTPLGTGGAILNSLQFIDENEPCLVLNGDSFLQVDYKKLLAAHKTKLTMVLRRMDDCSRYGSVITEGDKITGFTEKSAEKKSGFINGGIYVLNPKFFEMWAHERNLLGKNFSFEKDFMMSRLHEANPRGFVAEGYFIDIGIPDDYAKAQKELPQFIKNKALFLDRDGVINHDFGHVHKRSDFRFVGGIFEMCKRAQDLGYLLIIVTNQAGIAKGMYSEEEFLELSKWIENEFSKHGVKIIKTFYCPYHVEAVVEKYRRDSQDRKPKPGMILKAIAEFNIDPEISVLIGDRQTDIQAAEAAGVANRILLKDDKSFKEFFNSNTF